MGNCSCPSGSAGARGHLYFSARPVSRFPPNLRLLHVEAAIMAGLVGRRN